MATFIQGMKNAVAPPKQQQPPPNQQQQQPYGQQQRPGTQPFAPHAPVAMGHNPMWTTRLGQCQPPANCEQWMCAWFCCQCASAQAKTRVDGTNVCYNFMCWHFGGAMSFIRREYGIKGSCGDDCMCSLFCYPCFVRRGITEAEIRGRVPSPFAQPGAQPTREWMHTLFSCDCCEFFEALLCPFCVAHYTRNMLQPYERGDCCFDMACVIPAAIYGQVRHHHGIIAEFDTCEDICLPIWCYPCALIQARKEAAYWFSVQLQQNKRGQNGQPAQVAGHNGRSGCCCC
jgi:hypothetical protein